MKIAVKIAVFRMSVCNSSPDEISSLAALLKENIKYINMLDKEDLEYLLSFTPEQIRDFFELRVEDIEILEQLTDEEFKSVSS